MSKKTLTVTGTGDALFVAPFPEYYSQEKKKVTDFINAHQVKITNLETNLSDFGSFANSYSGGTWINTKKEYFSHLASMGFNFYGTANNHCMDYSFKGLLSTIEHLDEMNLAHAGTGATLDEAEAPAILTVDDKKIAIFAVDCIYQPPSKAGRATKTFEGRPGVNFLRHEKSYLVSKEQQETLRQIAKDTGINFTREQLIATGYATPDPYGVFKFGEVTFTTNKDQPKTICNKKDKRRLLDLIKKSKKENDYVFLQIHCHDNDDVSHRNPPAYLTEFCRSCIDNGVSAIFGGGAHELRPIEIYKGKPIFYSLGDFIYQGPQVEYLPADFMEQYGVDINATAQEALNVRSRNGKVGLHLEKKNYQTVLPSLKFEGEKMTSFKLLPLELNFAKTDLTNGLPTVANREESQQIVDLFNQISAPFGSQFMLDEQGFILLKD